MKTDQKFETILTALEDYRVWYDDKDQNDDDRQRVEEIDTTINFVDELKDALPNKDQLTSFRNIIKMYKEEETRHYLEGCDWIESEKDEKEALKQVMNTDHMLKHLMVLEQWIKKAKKVV